MNEKNLTVYDLCGVYGELLTENQREAVEYYYGMDLSLSEIADLKGVSRQAVKDMLDKAEQLLVRYESALGLYGKLRLIEETAYTDGETGYKEKILSILRGARACDKKL